MGHKNPCSPPGKLVHPIFIDTNSPGGEQGFWWPIVYDINSRSYSQSKIPIRTYKLHVARDEDRDTTGSKEHRVVYIQDRTKI